jgi:hypothetical protein
VPFVLHKERREGELKLQFQLVLLSYSRGEFSLLQHLVDIDEELGAALDSLRQREIVLGAKWSNFGVFIEFDSVVPVAKRIASLCPSLSAN